MFDNYNFIVNQTKVVSVIYNVNQYFTLVSLTTTVLHSSMRAMNSLIITSLSVGCVASRGLFNDAKISASIVDSGPAPEKQFNS